jgi:hypothetical protein
MKKHFTVLILCCILTANIIYGQKSYFKADFGYGLGINGSDYISGSRTYNITVDTMTYFDTYKYNKISFGSGFYPGLTYGYLINKYLSFEMNLTFFKEKSKIIKTKDDYNIVYGYSSMATYQSKFTSNALYVTPSLTLSPDLEKINPYLRLGFIFGKCWMKTENDNTLYNAFSGSASPYTHVLNEWSSYGGLSTGLKSTAGMEFYFTDKMKLFCELSYYSISNTPKKAKIKMATLDGVDQKPSMTIKDKEIEFVDEYSTNSATDPDKPRTELKTTYNKNACSMNLGIKILL